MALELNFQAHTVKQGVEELKRLCVAWSKLPPLMLFLSSAVPSASGGTMASARNSVSHLWLTATQKSMIFAAGVNGMKVENKKIVEITEAELFSLYLERNMDDIMDFNEYRYRMEKAGCVVKDGDWQ
jgi:hypothetical protein